MSSQKGPLPRFAEAHVRTALELIAKHRRIGREQLADELGVGEGSMRTILNRLKKQGLITSSRGGHAITAKGRLRFQGKLFRYVQVDAVNLTVGKVDVAIIVRGAASKIGRGVEQRDEAIKAGANGATILIYRGGRFEFPDRAMGIKKYEKVMRSLTEIFDPKEGDVLIIGTGRDTRSAELGASAAARTLL